MIEYYVRYWFYKQGLFCAKHPLVVFAATFALAVLMATLLISGAVEVVIEERPKHLWVQPSSRANKDMDFFDKSFRPFFRIEELIITLKHPTGPGIPGHNVLVNEALLELADFYENISKLADPETGTRLIDFCWRPIVGKGCMMQSVLGFFQHNRTKVVLATQAPGGIGRRIAQCVQTPLAESCYNELGLPIEHTTIFGHEDFDFVNNTRIAEASLSTYLLENSENNQTYIDVARSWEKNVFLKVAEEWAQRSDTVNVYYMSERSVQDAINSLTRASAMNVAISYTIMFVYISLALGYWSRIHSRFTAAFVGIVIVGLSLLTSLTFCSAINIPMTLIITDVIPFLLVAIGVDNMFIIANQFWFRCRVKARMRQIPLTKEQIELCMAEALCEVGGTIFLAGVSEGMAFSMGSLTPMPAVRAFCLYSGVAILFNLALQVTAYVSFLTLDARRAARHRMDLLPCIAVNDELDSYHAISTVAAAVADDLGDVRASTIIDGTAQENEDLLVREKLQRESITSRDSAKLGSPASPVRDDEISVYERTTEETIRFALEREETRDGGLTGMLRSIRMFLAQYYVPYIIFNRFVQVLVVVVFVGFAVAALFFVTPDVQLGLSQSDSFPDNSYLREMFETMNQQLDVGPLIYFAVPGHPEDPLVNFSDPLVFQAMTQLSDTLQTATPYIDVSTVASWYDDLRHWVCYNHDIMPVEVVPTPDNGCIDLEKLHVQSSEFNCSLNANAERFPFDRFADLVDAFIHQPDCCKFTTGINTGICGFQFGEEVALGDVYIEKDPATNKSLIWPVPEGTTRKDSMRYVKYSRIRAQTVRLGVSADYISSFQAAYNVTDTLSSLPLWRNASFSSYPYSIYFVYYAQYLEIADAAIQDVSMAIGSILVITLIVLSSVSSTLSIALCLLLILIDLVTLMVWWDISINAISVVNIVMCCGISVEFCAHIAVLFCGSKGPIKQRMMVTMVDMGSNVTCGITLTKLLGVLVLNFSPSRVFRIYYFRMYAAIIVLGGLHGLLFLPCLLLLIGVPFRKKKNTSLCSL